MNFKTIIALIFIALIVIFSVQNVAVTEVDFLVWKLEMSRVLIILGSFGIGLFVGILISMTNKLKKKELNILLTLLEC